MITKDFKIKVIDLGFGVPLAGKEGGGFMKSDLGTPMYKAPEIRDRETDY